MSLELNYTEGQTPIDDDERERLLIPTIATRQELDEFEQLNIEEAMLWLLGRRFMSETVFGVDFVLALHRRMFGKVWRWAGHYRRTNKNIGIHWHHVPVALRSLCDDAKLWHAQSIYGPDELALRFKHRIVSIHCFPNGNGRHSRLMADAIVHRLYGAPLFQWSGTNLGQTGTARTVYLAALRHADAGNLEPLIRFARS